MFAWRRCPGAARDGQPRVFEAARSDAEVAVAPGVGYGEDGEGYVRIAMVENEQRLRQAARNIRRYLSAWASTPALHKTSPGAG